VGCQGQVVQGACFSGSDRRFGMGKKKKKKKKCCEKYKKKGKHCSDCPKASKQ